MSERASITSLDILVSASLECPICIDYFTVPIFQCDNGHAICDRCSKRSPNCPFCKFPIGRKLRNYNLEQQLSLIDIYCNFKGCNAQIKLASRIVHENECKFNPNNGRCIMPGCK